MGWFDGDSSEEESPKRKKPELLSASDLLDHGGTKAEEEEDPLDAYMNSLNSIATTAATTQTRASRLDLDNEEEATSHWQEQKKKKSTEEEDDDFDADGFVKRSAVAKRAMEQTFHKAGAKKKDDDSDEDDNHNKSQRSKEIDIQLEQVNHQEMKYETFEKVFWNPSNNNTTTNNPQDQSWRKQHGITIHPDHYQTQFSPIYFFLELKDVLETELLNHITKSGYHTPTPVQAQTLPIALGGHDALITAPTGSGKTLAYVWPMVVHVCAQHHLQAHETGPIGLILVPTRELALQVEKHVQSMIKVLQGTSLTIIGGMGKYPLVQHLRQKGGVEIVVATPGRLLDVLQTKQQSTSGKAPKGLSLERTTMVVLDECDRLLHMGFQKQVSQILQNIRPDRQTLMLSATMSKRIETVAQQWLGEGGNHAGIGHKASEYVRLAVGRTGQASLNVQQHVMVVPNDHAKLVWLQQMLPVLAGVGRTLVFVATKEGCEQLAGKLGDQIHTVTLHGDKHQSDRNAALRKFVKNEHIVLIATDVASRGLDIPKVATVINYDPPKNLDVHVHRVGRAGRLSNKEQQARQGAAYTLLRTPKDADIGHVLLGALEREDREVPDELRELAMKSRQYRGGDGSNDPARQSRKRWNKAGLGASEPTYYGQQPAMEAPPPPKKSRWG